MKIEEFMTISTVTNRGSMLGGSPPSGAASTRNTISPKQLRIQKCALYALAFLSTALAVGSLWAALVVNVGSVVISGLFFALTLLCVNSAKKLIDFSRPEELELARKQVKKLSLQQIWNQYGENAVLYNLYEDEEAFRLEFNKQIKSLSTREILKLAANIESAAAKSTYQDIYKIPTVEAADKARFKQSIEGLESKFLIADTSSPDHWNLSQLEARGFITKDQETNILDCRLEMQRLKDQKERNSQNFEALESIKQLDTSLPRKNTNAAFLKKEESILASLKKILQEA